MDDASETPILCRTAMLELELDYEGMAELLKIDASRVLQICIAGENIPRHLQHTVHILLNSHRYRTVRRPIMELVHDLMWHLYGEGRMHLNEVINAFGLSGPQLKNIEQVEGWVTLVWEPTGPKGRDGRHAFIYLTAAGYKELGMIVPEQAQTPSPNATEMVIKGMDVFRRMVIERIQKDRAYCLERAENDQTLITLAITGLAPINTVVEMFGELTEQSAFTQITDETDETEE